MSSLSHSMTCRSSIAAGSIGTSSSRRSRVSTKPPGCCERWRGVPMSWRESSSVRRRRRSSRLRLSSFTSFSLDPLDAPAPDEAGERRRSRPPAGRAPCRPRARRRARGSGSRSRSAPRGRGRSVVDPLDHLLPPLVLEVDVDVRRLAALLARRSARTGARSCDRVDRGDAEHVADGRVRRRCRGPGRGCSRGRAKRTMEFTVRK